MNYIELLYPETYTFQSLVPSTHRSYRSHVAQKECPAKTSSPRSHESFLAALSCFFSSKLFKVFQQSEIGR